MAKPTAPPCEKRSYSRGGRWKNSAALLILKTGPGPPGAHRGHRDESKLADQHGLITWRVFFKTCDARHGAAHAARPESPDRREGVVFERQLVSIIQRGKGGAAAIGGATWPSWRNALPSARLQS